MFSDRDLNHAVVVVGWGEDPAGCPGQGIPGPIKCVRNNAVCHSTRKCRAVCTERLYIQFVPRVSTLSLHHEVSCVVRRTSSVVRCSIVLPVVRCAVSTSTSVRHRMRRGQGIGLSRTRTEPRVTATASGMPSTLNVEPAVAYATRSMACDARRSREVCDRANCWPLPMQSHR